MVSFQNTLLIHTLYRNLHKTNLINWNHLIDWIHIEWGETHVSCANTRLSPDSIRLKINQNSAKKLFKNHTFIVNSANSWHSWDGCLFGWDRSENFVNQNAQIKEINSGWESSKNDETQGQIGSNIRHPNGGKRVSQLNSAFTKVKDKQAKAAKHYNREVFPIS